MTLKTIKAKLDKLPTKDNTPKIIVCWCKPGRPCPYHTEHPDAPEPRHVYTVAGINLETDI